MAEERVMLITGASTGIGEATARRAVSDGWRVALGARREERLSALASKLGGEERAVVRACDVTDLGDQEALAGAALDAFGRLDAIFANAGFGAKRGFLEESEEHWRSMVLTNVLGVALTIRATLPHMLASGAGHYLFTGSVAGRRALPGSLYSSTKWAVTGMAESLRQEIRKMHDNHAIRVTLVEPGMTDTPFFTQSPADALAAGDIAEAVMYAVSQPDRVDVNEILIRPTSQST